MFKTRPTTEEILTQPPTLLGESRLQAILHAEAEMLLMREEENRKKAGKPALTIEQSKEMFTQLLTYLSENDDIIRHLLDEEPQNAWKRRTTTSTGNPFDDVLRVFPDLADILSAKSPPASPTPTPSPTLSESTFASGLPFGAKTPKSAPSP